MIEEEVGGVAGIFNNSMSNLEHEFKCAKEMNAKFVAVKIEMDGFAEAEIIVNPIINADSKLEYYKKTYDENLIHKYAKGIRIIGFTFGDSVNEIHDELTLLY